MLNASAKTYTVPVNGYYRILFSNEVNGEEYAVINYYSVGSKILNTLYVLPLTEEDVEKLNLSEQENAKININ